MKSPFTWIALFILLAAGAARAQETDWEAYAGQRIATIHILASEVFDPQEPGEDLRLMGWANALHMVTRDAVIRRELLFQEGDELVPRLVARSERNLRAIGVFQDADIDVEPGPEGLTLFVRTADRWATKVITDLSSEGSITRLRLGLENINFLGRAKQFGGVVEASTDVDAFNLFFRDPRLLGSRWMLDTGYFHTNLSEGQRLGVEYPFYSDDVRWGGGYVHYGDSGDRRVFFGGDRVDSLFVDERRNEAFVAHQIGHGTLQRIGVLGSHQRLSGDVGQHRASVGVSWAIMRREFRPMRRVDLFGVVEDVAAGWMLQVLAGADLQSLGADDDRPLWRADGTISWFLGRGGFLGFQVRHHGFAQRGAVQNSRLLLESWGFWKSEAQTLAWSLGAVAFEGEPEYVRMTLGGDARLRGYPARQQTGTRALWANVEERLFSNLRLYFLHLGAAVFVDVGQAWDAPVHPSWRGFDIGTGAGLRIGNNKSGNGILRVDVAHGRDGWALSLSSGSFFRAARSLVFPSVSLFQ
jgi:hypothetical protein